MRTIARHGFAHTTMAHVAAAAGLSQGIVNFYFKSKDGLLYETLVHLAEEYEDTLRRALDRAGPDPVAALDAMIDADLGPEVCNPTKIPVWLAFWAESCGQPKYRKLCAKLSEEYFRQARDLCVRLADRGGYSNMDIDSIARGFNAMIDGLWVDQVIDPKFFDRNQAKLACRAYLAGYFPAEFGPLADSVRLTTKRRAI